MLQCKPLDFLWICACVLCNARCLRLRALAQVIVSRVLRLHGGLMARGVPGSGAKRKASAATPSTSASSNPGDAEHGLQPMQGLARWKVVKRMGIDDGAGAAEAAETASAAESGTGPGAEEDDAEEDEQEGSELAPSPRDLDDLG